jgi:4-hydroxy-3-polyprenylbenzoate decarboxylase
LFAIGSERYTPFAQTKQPAEILTIANHVLGTGQLSLAKYLFITADDTKRLHAHHPAEFLSFVLERIHLNRDIHFYTNTSIDTLDYSGESLNSGSKVVIAAYGEPIRKLSATVPNSFNGLQQFVNPQIAMPGVVALQTKAFTNAANAATEMQALDEQLNTQLESLQGIAIIVVCDDASFVADTMNNFLWATFTRSNPSHDMYGIAAFVQNKHWGCRGPLVIDARIKPHHAPALVKDAATEKKVDEYFKKGGVLSKWG